MSAQSLQPDGACVFACTTACAMRSTSGEDSLCVLCVSAAGDAANCGVCGVAGAEFVLLRVGVEDTAVTVGSSSGKYEGMRVRGSEGSSCAGVDGFGGVHSFCAAVRRGLSTGLAEGECKETLSSAAPAVLSSSASCAVLCRSISLFLSICGVSAKSS